MVVPKWRQAFTNLYVVIYKFRLYCFIIGFNLLFVLFGLVPT